MNLEKGGKNDKWKCLNRYEPIDRTSIKVNRKIAEGLTGLARPWQIRRVAHAEADAGKIKALSKLEISEMEYRTLQNLLSEESKKQQNISEITKKAIPQLETISHPENIDNDWIANFFDKCKLISDQEMQFLWSKVLAGEANSPGHFSKRTVNLLGSLEKSDAVLFQVLCGYSWVVNGSRLLVYDMDAEIYNKNNINISRLMHLEEIGLISYQIPSELLLTNLPKAVRTSYFGKQVIIEFPNELHNQLNFGHVTLTKVGLELAMICESKPIHGFFEYVLDLWKNKYGLNLS